MRIACLAFLMFAAVTPASAVGIRVATFNIGAHFTVDGFPDYSLGDPGTVDHDRVRDILARINADVVALEEVASADVSGNPDDLDALAASLGYTHLYVAPVTDAAPLKGPIDTSLRVAFLSRYPFLSTTAVRSPLGAKEITRLHPVVKVDVPGTANDPVLVAAHLKSGTTQADRFRRAVDLKRLVGNLSTQGLTNDDNFIVMGDFNLSSSNTTFTTLPADIPVSYILGADIVLPVTYSTNPLSYFSNPGVTRLDLRQLNNSTATFQSGSSIDVMLVSPAIAGRPHASEIYNSTLDVSNIGGLPKAGSPLAATTSAQASDHYAVFSDLELDSDYPNLDLTISASSVTEGSADGTVTVSARLPATKATAVTVSIASDDPAAASPASSTITIPAGSLTGSVNVKTPRDFIDEGQRSVTFTATAVGYDPDSAVLNVNDVDGPYTFTAAGQVLTENFGGFGGDHDPAPWVSAGGQTWRGLDDGASAVAGFRSYGPAADASLGFLPQGAGSTVSATFVNQSPVLLTALRISLDVEQWRAALNGAADGLSASLWIGGQSVPLPGLSFTANRALPSGAVPGGGVTTLTATATGLSIPPATAFELRVSFNAGSTAGVLPNDVFVNEFHYDNASTDVGEFVEIAVGPGFTAPLSSVSLVIYNGSDGKAAATTHPLDTFSAGTVTSSGHKLYYKYIAGLQNDSEGFAIVSGGTVLHFISYEGAFVATTGPAVGMTAVNIGVTQSGSDPIGFAALGLFGSGGVTGDFTWKKFTGIAHSPGQPNDGQTFSLPVLPPQGLAIDNMSATFLTDHDQDGAPDETDPDDDNDSQPDAYEIAFGSDPFNSGSRFLPLITRAAAAPHGLQLTFPAAAGITYTVETGTTLNAWQDLTTVTGNGSTVVIPLPSSGPQRFFRVKAAQ